ncbi:MAG: carboxypeptidase regulatory-like domain-containing protein [Acidobacteria bacterium]|nr:MAG: carboxypeptidase regulatory-like domain-containing protein [Acidobacteriota bacterium]
MLRRLCLIAAGLLLTLPLWSQATARISGLVTDASGATIAGAAISVTSSQTGWVRHARTSAHGFYQVAALPAGSYRVAATKSGFAAQGHGGVGLAVGQSATVDLRLRLGGQSQRVSVGGRAAVVSVTSAGAAGLVEGQTVRDLPLNGRSYDQLLTLNPGVVNFTAEKVGGVGVSNSTVANDFAVSGNRPQQNLFLLNGIEFTGAAENNMQPGGVSGQLLGADAVAEVNTRDDSYNATYGKRPGAQVQIVTRGGGDAWHGSVYEYLRNNVMDARNFFDRERTPGLQRHQFGAAAGGPLQRGRTFLFVNAEGFNQHLHQTGVDLVPDAQARQGLLPCALVSHALQSCPPSGLVPVGVNPGVASWLNLWPAPAANSPDLGGIAEVFNQPLQTIRDGFFTSRLDRVASPRDLITVVYTLDESSDHTPTRSNAFSTDIESLGEQVVSLEQNFAISPDAVNVLRAGYSRAAYFYTGEPTPGTPAAAVPGFLQGLPPGAVVVGGSAASNPAAQLSLAGSNNGSQLNLTRNLFTAEDTLTLTRGRDTLQAGYWAQRVESNEDLALSQYGQASFTGLQALLAGKISTFLFDPSPTEMYWRSWLGAPYLDDTFRWRPNLLIEIGYRGEFTTGWNEAQGHAANFILRDGVLQTQPRIARSAFTVNRATFLSEPRLGLSWSPFAATVLRAGFGLYNDLQDALGYRLDQNAPFNPTYSLANIAAAQLPIAPGAIPAAAKVLPAGVQPDLYTPTLVSWSMRVEHALGANSSASLGYVGSHGYHEILSLDDNEPVPVRCPSRQCPASYPGNFPAGIAGTPVPTGADYIPTGTPRRNPALGAAWAWYSEGNSSYNALQLEVRHRFGAGSLRGAYTWSKALDDGDSLNSTAAGNAPGLVSDPANLHADWGPATYNVTQAAVVEAAVPLPRGWTLTSILTLQSGFPFTPQLSYNPSNNGDSKNPVRPFQNPNFSGPVIVGRPGEWFNPAAFLAPPPGSGFYGNAGRNSLAGPGLADWDLSMARDLALGERWHVRLSADAFNVLNHANFRTPNAVVFTPAGASPTAGVVTATSTPSRQIQLGLRVVW